MLMDPPTSTRLPDPNEDVLVYTNDTDDTDGSSNWKKAEASLIQVWKDHWHLTKEETHQRLKNEQLTSLRRLFNRQDVILIAKTGFGKSLIFHSLPFMRPNSTAIIVCPLIALENDQAASLAELPGAKPCVLNHTTSADETIYECISNGEYTHILTSPEILTSDPFFKLVWQNDEFLKRLCLFAIDEAHVIEEWGSSFREAYGNLHTLRVFTSRYRTPWFATSATLDVISLQKCQESAGFVKGETEFLKTCIDREDITLNLQKIRHRVGSFKDLHFLAKRPGLPVPKTIIYCDEIAMGRELISNLRKWFVQEGYRNKDTRRLIKAYNSQVDVDEQLRISKDFLSTTATHRIIVATDSLGMGLNNPDVQLVIQWRLPRTSSPLSILWQRAGRAARQQGLEGEFIFFFEQRFKGPRSGPNRVELRENSGPKGTTDRSTIAEPLWKLINSTKCYREVWLDHFGDKPSGPRPRRGCCNKCTILHTTDDNSLKRNRTDSNSSNDSTSSQISFSTPQTPESWWYRNPGADKAIQREVQKALRSWADEQVKTRFVGSMMLWATSEVFLDQQLIKRWANNAYDLANRPLEGVHEYLIGWDPVWFEEYHQELYYLIRDTAKVANDRAALTTRRKPPPRSKATGRPNQHNKPVANGSKLAAQQDASPASFKEPPPAPSIEPISSAETPSVAELQNDHNHRAPTRLPARTPELHSSQSLQRRPLAERDPNVQRPYSLRGAKKQADTENYVASRKEISGHKDTVKRRRN